MPQGRKRLKPRKKPRPRIWLMGLIGLVVIGGAVAGAYFAFFSDEPEKKIAGPLVAPKGTYWFQDDRFGIMVTWGPASITGKEISWSRGGGRPCDETRERDDIIPREKYDNLYHGFSPSAFDADAWVDLFKRAGARYVVFVAKHHDGFCMFDSKLTEYKITKSFYGRDVAADLAAACHRADLHLGFYYSLPDWIHRDYCSPRHNDYVKYLHGQMRELCGNYGPVHIIWLDGLNLPPTDWDAHGLLKLIQEIQPHALVNDGAGIPGSFTTRKDQIGGVEAVLPWEYCTTIGTQWSYKPDDKLKTASECLCDLVRVAGRGGNLLLNVGPQSDGRIEARQAETLLQIGAWLEKCGEGVYKTRVGPYEPTDQYVSTRRGRIVYLHLLERPTGAIDLPAHGRTVLASAMLTGGTAAVQHKEDRLLLSVEVPEGEQPPWTVRLELDAVPTALPSE